MDDRVADYYRANPRMVSSPFGGVDGLNRELLEEVLERLDIGLESRRILDVGCGRGYLGEAVEEAGGTYTGVDFVASRAGFRLVLADAEGLPFADGAFDGVFCIDAFEHFPDPHRTAIEFRRVLGPGGYLFLSAPNYANVAGLVKKAYEAFGAYEKNSWAPFGRWQPQELETPLTGAAVRRIFRTAGFRKIRRVAHGPEVGLGLFPWIDHPKMPEAIQFRLQRLFKVVGPSIARVWPGASLHGFWKLEP